ncbi:hypothetical protein HME9302_01436 [Alteripontixanthobacter maritimus]|uniref:Restriction endonuclease n=1 Tax=Alteripontixanthobacter maritimus TaxID=2161824 RepID=A0A369Q9K6_9SPHN|nr:hypothetical protein [Alteripontixanthobacter maritimus]RDC60235.1 hypothetical protein HME9302_01436 [Alteripontixanthobacter maritimus]
MTNTYSLYKPLRNHLRQFNMYSGLEAAYSFMQFLDYNRPLPDKLRINRLFTKSHAMKYGIVQWEFETLIREIILNSPEQGGKEFKNWSDVAKAINLIKRTENDIYGAHDGPDDDVLFELIRIAHRQFPWQTGINQEHVARYHWLYRQVGLITAVRDTFGMSVTELFQISVALSGHFTNSPVMNVPVSNSLNSVSNLQMNNYINELSYTIATLREKYKELESHNVNWAYTFNPLRGHPLIRLSDSKIFCPITNFLLRRITSGLYFDIIKLGDTGSKFLGPAVQGLIGKVAHTAGRENLRVLPEQKYGAKKSRKDSIDWIVSDETGHLFVEAKAAQIRFRGISDLMDREQIRKEFDRIRGFALQAYQTLSDALCGRYSHWQPDGKDVFLTVVTLEDWQSFGVHVEREVLEPLARDLQRVGVDPKLPNKIPMTFCPVADFEAALYVANKKTIAEIFQRKSEGEYPQWSLANFIYSEFGSELQEFTPVTFSAEWDRLTNQST